MSMGTSGYQSTNLDRIEIPEPPLSSKLIKLMGWMVVALLLAWSFHPVEMHKSTLLWTDGGNMATFASGFLKPNFHEWRAYLGEMVETVQIAI